MTKHRTVTVSDLLCIPLCFSPSTILNFERSVTSWLRGVSMVTRLCKLVTQVMTESYVGCSLTVIRIYNMWLSPVFSDTVHKWHYWLILIWKGVLSGDSVKKSIPVTGRGGL
jgi:hypothetical protein